MLTLEDVVNSLNANNKDFKEGLEKELKERNVLLNLLTKLISDGIIRNYIKDDPQLIIQLNQTINDFHSLNDDFQRIIMIYATLHITSEMSDSQVDEFLDLFKRLIKSLREDINKANNAR